MYIHCLLINRVLVYDKLHSPAHTYMCVMHVFVYEYIFNSFSTVLSPVLPAFFVAKLPLCANAKFSTISSDFPLARFLWTAPCRGEGAYSF
jgi:hypothetical protein